MDTHHEHPENVVQPPSAESSITKPASRAYRRNLPHLQTEAKPLFITFSTMKRWVLPEHVRYLVIQHCLHDHGRRIHLHGVVVMPDHVHMIFTPLRDSQGGTFGIAEIMNGIKGASAHTINKALNRTGHVWQDESFDHILRSCERLQEKIQYICNNPVRKGLVKSEKEYPWLWKCISSDNG